MKVRRMLCFALVVALMSVWLTACAKEESAGETYEKYTSIAASTDGIVAIPTDGITSAARFFNYDANGVTVQLVALRDKENGVHIAFNTCQSCSPSPKAYYTQSGNVLKCANCGFTFEPEEVGITQGGCNPWPIVGVAVGEAEITLPVSSIEGMSAVFASWKGPTE